MMLIDYHRDVRTTLTLDDDIKAKLDQEVRKNGNSFKEAVNYYLRIGLDVQAQMRPAKAFVVRARPLGLKPGLSYDNVYHRDVRTTLTLDDDIKAKLDQEVRKNGKSFKEAVNYYLRIGLDVQANSQIVDRKSTRLNSSHLVISYAV